MTDRQAGSVDINVDVTALPTRQIGADLIQLDIMPPLIGERQTDSYGIMVDAVIPQGVQYGSFDMQVELKENPARRTGGLVIMLDYVPSLIPTGAVRWSSSSRSFQITGSDPMVMWSTADTFVTSGSFPIVIWNDVANRFEQAP